MINVSTTDYNYDLGLFGNIDSLPEDVKNKVIYDNEIKKFCIYRAIKLNKVIKYFGNYDFDPNDLSIPRDLVIESSKDILSHIILRSVCGYDFEGKIEDWFINGECSLLRLKLIYLISKDPTYFVSVLGKLMGSTEYIMTSTDFCFYYNLNDRQFGNIFGFAPSDDYIMIRWNLIPNIIRNRKCVMYKGMCLVDLRDNDIINTAVKRFGIELRKKIDDKRLSIKDDEIEFYTDIIKVIDKYLKKSGATVYISMGDLNDDIKLFPICMRAIDLMIGNGSVPDRSVLIQLGFFLRECGMKLNDYLRYWYLRHPSNRDKSWEDFLSSHWGSYELPHHYGEVGGGKKYSSMSCKKIMSDGLCPYKDWEFEDIVTFLKPYFDETIKSGIRSNDDAVKCLNKIRNLKRKGYYGACCSEEFLFRFGTDRHKYVSHPVYDYFVIGKMFIKRIYKQNPK